MELVSSVIWLDCWWNVYEKKYNFEKKEMFISLLEDEVTPYAVKGAGSKLNEKNLF